MTIHFRFINNAIFVAFFGKNGPFEFNDPHTGRISVEGKHFEYPVPVQKKPDRHF